MVQVIIGALIILAFLDQFIFITCNLVNRVLFKPSFYYYFTVSKSILSPASML